MTTTNIIETSGRGKHGDDRAPFSCGHGRALLHSIRGRGSLSVGRGGAIISHGHGGCTVQVSGGQGRAKVRLVLASKVFHSYNYSMDQFQ